MQSDGYLWPAPALYGLTPYQHGTSLGYTQRYILSNTIMTARKRNFCRQVLFEILSFTPDDSALPLLPTLRYRATVLEVVKKESYERMRSKNDNTCRPKAMHNRCAASHAEAKRGL